MYFDKETHRHTSKKKNKKKTDMSNNNNVGKITVPASAKFIFRHCFRFLDQWLQLDQ